MVSLNPALILGPGVRYHKHSESFKTIRTIAGEGLSNYLALLSGIPDIATPVVDVRDVAYAHIKAAFCTDSVALTMSICCSMRRTLDFAWLILFLSVASDWAN